MSMKRRTLLSMFIVLVALLVVGSNLTLTNASVSYHEDSTLFRFELNERWGYIDRNGNIKISPTFLAADDFSEGLATVIVMGKTEEDSLSGFIDSKGEFVLEPKFYTAGPFTEGLAMVEFEPYKFGCIDKEGNVVFTLTDFAYEYCEGLSAASDIDRGMGYIDKTGKWVIEPIYWPAKSFSEGLASVCYEDMYGYINHKGEVVIPFQYYSAESFQEGLAWVQYSRDERGFYINQTGEKVTELDFPRIGTSFSEGLTYASVDDQLYGYVNQKGEWVIKPQYTKAKNFSEGLAAVKMGDEYYFIDKKGKIKICLEGMSSCISGFKNGLARVYKDKKEVFINTEGKVVFTVQ